MQRGLYQAYFSCSTNLIVCRPHTKCVLCYAGKNRKNKKAMSLPVEESCSSETTSFKLGAKTSMLTCSQ